MTTTPPTGPGTWGSSETPLGAAPRGRGRQGPRPSRSARASSPSCAAAAPSRRPPWPACSGTNSGATSYHLRRLETVGLVEDTDTGKGKERIWRAAVEQHSWTQSELVDDEDALTALNWLERDYIRHFATKAEQWLDVQQDWPVEWVDHLGINDNVALVTLDQLRAMRAEIEDVLLKYRRVGQGNPQAKRVAVYTYAYPVDLDQSPRGDRS